MNGQNQNVALDAKAIFKSIERALQDRVSSLRQAIPAAVGAQLTPERLIRIALHAVSHTPLLLQCTLASIVRAVMDAASLGLDPSGGSLAQGYLIPYKRRDKKTDRYYYECQFMPGYRGYIALAIRSGEMRSVYAQVVRDKDHFDFEYGLNDKLCHRPCLGEQRGEIIAAYCIATFFDGLKTFHVMGKPDIDAARKCSKANGADIWGKHYAEMARKTVVRNAFKYWPIKGADQSGLSKAVEIESRAESDEPDNTVVDASFDDSKQLTSGGISQADSILNELGQPGQKEEAQQ